MAAYENSKHYLHQAYQRGYKAGLEGDDQSPFMPGTHEQSWWWDGWGEGVLEKWSRAKKDKK